jgi:hypothetical protein
MTGKDYELIAGSIARTRQVTEWVGVGGQKVREAKLAALRLVAIDLASSLAHENPRFDQARFLKAAGI